MSVGKARKSSSSPDDTAFYARALTAAERVQFESAVQVDGIDEEIALLRLRMRELAERAPGRLDLQMDLATTIARLVKTRYQVSSEQRKSLKAAVAKVLEEVAVPLGIGVGVGVGGTLTNRA
ncbi:MAG TPA: hypothetical protein ENL12_02970 [Dehalococcoidia bacterium]|nr:hypothetical protein [Dehalococcoidia bacterium]